MVFDVVEDGGDVVVKTAFFAVGVCDLEEEGGLVGWLVGRGGGCVLVAWKGGRGLLLLLLFFLRNGMIK